MHRVVLPLKSCQRFLRRSLEEDFVREIKLLQTSRKLLGGVGGGSMRMPSCKVWRILEKFGSGEPTAQHDHNPPQKSPRAHKIKSALLPPPPQNEWRFSCGKKAFFQAPIKLAQPFASPELRTKNFMDTRIFLTLTFTRVPAKVPHIHPSSGEGALGIVAAFQSLRGDSTRRNSPSLGCKPRGSCENTP